MATLWSDGVTVMKLSQTNIEVARLTAQGLSIKEIAAQLCLAPQTAANYRCRALQYYNVQNATQLAHKFLHFGNIKNIYATRSNHQR